MYPRSPYERPIQPQQLVICLVVGVVGAVVYVICTLIGFLFRLAFRRR